MNITRDIKNSFSLVPLLLAIVGIVLSIYFYKVSQRKRVPMYQFSQYTSKVFDSSGSSKGIKVLDQDGAIIEGDVFLRSLAFWNEGELPIEPSDVRKPIRLLISEGGSK